MTAAAASTQGPCIGCTAPGGWAPGSAWRPTPQATTPSETASRSSRRWARISTTSPSNATPSPG
eukprot:4483903-Lingulodinium_polyedra.AAC.1